MDKLNGLTLEEKDLKRIANWCYLQKVNAITEIYKMCELTLSQFCTYIDMGISTYHKYENNECCMSSERFFQICLFFEIYVKEHSLPNEREIIKKIDQLTRLDLYLNAG